MAANAAAQRPGAFVPDGDHGDPAGVRSLIEEERHPAHQRLASAGAVTPEHQYRGLILPHGSQLAGVQGEPSIFAYGHRCLSSFRPGRAWLKPA